MRAWTVLGILSILLLSTAFPMFLASAQEPVRSLHMDPLKCMTPDVLVASNKSVSFSFETRVGIDDTEDEEVLVELNVTNDMDWPISIVPKSLNFTSPGSQKVNITVSVPAGTDTGIIAVIKLFGYAAFPGETTFASAFGYLYLKQSFGFAVNFTYIRLAPQETWVQLNIFNMGNGHDNFDVTVLEGDKVDSKDIVVIMSAHSLRISPNGSRPLEVHIMYEGTEFPLKFDLRLMVNSMGAQQQGALVQQIVEVPLSFKGPDPPIQPTIFYGVIGAFVIVVVIVLAVVLRGPAKKPK